MSPESVLCVPKTQCSSQSLHITLSSLGGGKVPRNTISIFVIQIAFGIGCIDYFEYTFRVLILDLDVGWPGSLT
jgi:hypothetical protein